MSVLETRTVGSILRAGIHTVINLTLMEQLRYGKHMFFSQIWVKILCIIKVSEIWEPRKAYSKVNMYF